MKHHFQSNLSIIALASFTAAVMFVGGCNSSDSSDQASGEGTKGTAATVKATPPPTLDTKALQSQQSAAQKASEEFRKKVESGQQ